MLSIGPLGRRLRKKKLVKGSTNLSFLPATFAQTETKDRHNSGKESARSGQSKGRELGQLGSGAISEGIRHIIARKADGFQDVTMFSS